MTDKTRVDRIHARLREAAAEVEAYHRQGRLHEGVRGAGVDNGGRPTPQGLDDGMWHDDARFTDTPSGQMQMTVSGDQSTYHVGKGQTAVTHDDGRVTYHPAGEESEPYATRPQDDGSRQLPLGRKGAFQPTDPALHTLRMANPHLNDYSFAMHVNPRGYHNITAIHTPTNSQAGSFSWKSKGMVTMEGNPHRAGEVDMIEVKDQHRGMGLSTAMWDYAHFHAGRDGSKVDHPMHSDNRSIEGNHWAHFVGGASMARTKGFNVQRYE